MNSSEEALLSKAFRELLIPYAADQLNAFSDYLSLLKKWSRAYNLTSLSNSKDIIVKHFIDSVVYLKAIPAHSRTLLDVGSGAGFPGIPIKIMRPDVNVVLLEPSRKKTSFLGHVVSSLKLKNIHVVRGRIEDYPCSQNDVPARFDVVVTRALFSTGELIRLSAPLCEETGLIVLSKGPAYTKEIDTTKGCHLRVEKVDLANFGLERYLIIAGPCRYL